MWQGCRLCFLTVSSLRSALLVLGALGLLALVWLTLHFGFADIAGAFASIGWGLALIVLVRVGVIALAGLAWRQLLPRGAAPFAAILRLRLVREAVNTLLPVAQVGGEFLGARLLAHRGVPGALAAASVIVDVFIQAATQFVFTLLGLALLLHAEGDAELVRSAAAGLALLGPALVAFYLVQRRGGFGFVEAMILRSAQALDAKAVWRPGELDAALKSVYRRRGGLWRSTAMHFGAWLLGVGEVLLALHFLGQAGGLIPPFVIESLGQAVRSAAFVVPGGYGVQEAGLIALCAGFGVAAPLALAISLAKRAAELSVGLAGLLAWHAAESAIVLSRERLNTKI